MRRFVAAGFGVGLLPGRLRGRDDGAGTLGALVAAGIAATLLSLPLSVHVVAIAVAIILSLWTPLPYLAQDRDPGWVAIDEVAGTLLALTALSGPGWLVAWVVARLADIFKVLPGVRAAGSAARNDRNHGRRSGSRAVRARRRLADDVGRVSA